MAQRASFAGVEAAIGAIVLTVFFTFGVIGAIGVVALFAVGQLPVTGTNVGTLIGGLAVLALFGWKILRDARLVRVIEIADDGTWILKSIFGLERTRISPTQARTFTVNEQLRWILTGVARRMKASWAEIEVDGRVWKTCMNPPASQKEAITLIRSWIRERSG